MSGERILTTGQGGRILTNVNVWSPDSEWIAYDTRSDVAGSSFDGIHIQLVHTKSGEVRTVYESRQGANCGVVSWHPTNMQLVFILGPKHPTSEWTYSASRRQGVLLNLDDARDENLDARDLVDPFTPGTLRGGTHLHVFHPQGHCLCSTYEDEHHRDGLRNVAVHWLGEAVNVPRTDPRNHDGVSHSVLVTQTTAKPTPGSDEISRACEEAWVGQSHQIAFQGTVTLCDGSACAEVFLAELPENLEELKGVTLRANEPIQPPATVRQRRLTDTSTHRYPGLTGPRHWLRSNSEGTHIGCLKKDEQGVVQFWTVELKTKELRQVTHGEEPIQSAFTWHPDGERVALIRGGSVCLVNVGNGKTQHLTIPTDPPPRPEACVVSPDGKQIAFVRRIANANQIGIVSCG
jgi:hypothetical protein